MFHGLAGWLADASWLAEMMVTFAMRCAHDRCSLFDDVDIKRSLKC